MPSTMTIHRSCLVGVALLLLALATAGCDRQEGKQEESAPSASPVQDSGAGKTAVAKTRNSRRSHRKITVSRETTRLLGPLRPNGTVIYGRACNELAARGVTPENNAVVTLLHALGPKNVQSNDRDLFFAALKIAPVPEKGDYLHDPWDYCKALLRAALGKDEVSDREIEDRLGDQFARAGRRPFTESDFPQLARWLGENNRALELLVEASRQSRFYCPVVHRDPAKSGSMLQLTGMLFSLPPRRTIQALQYRAMYRLGKGQTDAACANLLACRHLARLYAQMPFTVDLCLCKAADWWPTYCDAAVLQQGKLAAVEMRRYRAELASLPPLPTMADKADAAERYLMLDSTILASQSPKDLGDAVRLYLDFRRRFGATSKASDGRSAVTKKDEVMVERIGKICEQFAADDRIDWDEALRMENIWWDRLVAVLRIADPPQKQTAYERLRTEIAALAGMSTDPAAYDFSKLDDDAACRAAADRIAALVLDFQIGLAKSWIVVEDQADMYRRLRDVAFGLALYRDRHGAYPDRLEALVPDFVSEVPDDLFGSGKVHYRGAANDYVVYGVGKNHRDDGGRDSSDNNRGENGYDDIVIRTPGREPPIVPTQTK